MFEGLPSTITWKFAYGSTVAYGTIRLIWSGPTERSGARRPLIFTSTLLSASGSGIEEASVRVVENPEPKIDTTSPGAIGLVGGWRFAPFTTPYGLTETALPL